jgi:hypothetical protein
MVRALFICACETYGLDFRASADWCTPAERVRELVGRGNAVE